MRNMLNGVTPEWFTAQLPWAWGRASAKLAAGIGNPQALLDEANFQFGFGLAVNPTLKGSQPSNQTPSTLLPIDSLLNAVASAMASGPPSARWGNDQG